MNRGARGKLSVRKLPGLEVVAAAGQHRELVALATLPGAAPLFWPSSLYVCWPSSVYT